MTATIHHVKRWHLVVDLVDHLVEGFDVEQLHLEACVQIYVELIVVKVKANTNLEVWRTLNIRQDQWILEENHM